MAGQKRRKGPKAKAAAAPNKPPSPPPAMDDDDDLMDDLMAQLDSRDANTQVESANVLSEMQINKAADSAPATPKDSKARHKARQARKAAALIDKYAPSDPEADVRLQKAAEEEVTAIKHTCDRLGVEVHQVTPDGHCLFSAIADQLAVLGVLPPEQATFAVCRLAAANYIHSHPNDFLPFLPSAGVEDVTGATVNTGLMGRAEFDTYCATIRDTAAWGGEPEILALSSAFGVPIHVVQGGEPPVVIHQPAGSASGGGATDKNVVRISYHRKLYGLGEHYNSLRPKSHSISDSLKAAFT